MIKFLFLTNNIYIVPCYGSFMNKKGGLLTNIIVLAVVFLVGTFFGWAILANLFGEDTVERLSPEHDIDQEELFSLCQGIREQICPDSGGDDVIVVGDSDDGIGVEELGFDSPSG